MAGDVIKSIGQNIFFTAHESPAAGVSIKCIFPQFSLLIIVIKHYSIIESHYF